MVVITALAQTSGDITLHWTVAPLAYALGLLMLLIGGQLCARSGHPKLAVYLSWAAFGATQSGYNVFPLSSVAWNALWFALGIAIIQWILLSYLLFHDALSGSVRH